jgi:hypothetical protein
MPTYRREVLSWVGERSRRPVGGLGPSVGLLVLAPPRTALSHKCAVELAGERMHLPRSRSLAR